jgi:subtilase family serine protease
MLIQLFICYIYLSYIFIFVKAKPTESLIPRDTLIKKDRINGDYIHEILISIKQLNIEILERELIERSTPSSPLYQQWLTYDEIGEITNDIASSNYVENWLLNIANVSITWTSRRHDFYKASAPISTWEKHFNSIFYKYHDYHIHNLHSSSISSSNTDDGRYNVHVLANNYTIPNILLGHVSAVFYTCQSPPAMNGHYSKLSSVVNNKNNNKFRNDVIIKSHLRSNEDKGLLNIKRKASNTIVTDVNFLNKLYNIDSNIGSYLINQSVFETSNEDYSPNDLLLFQQQYDQTQEAAIDIGGDISNTCGDPGAADCTEGNLDIQYIMGVAQRTTSFYWYVRGANAYVNWITDVGEEVNPPTSNSMSWGSDEYTESMSVMDSFNLAALKLTLLGVTITVSSGDNGAPSISSSNGACMCNTNSGSGGSQWNGSNTWTGSGYFPSFPATCPYVTAVGMNLTIYL